jgi:hypothetical protein
MGLFSRKPAVNVTSTEIKYNIRDLRQDMERLRKNIYDTRAGEGHRVFAKFVETMRNVELLEMANAKEMSSTSHAYHKGRIDALSSILNMRETCIADIKQIKTKDSKSRAENPIVRNYARRPSQAQPSI